jgi:putative redox protein
LIGSLDETQRTRLLQIADQCPVHRTLMSKFDIRTTPYI